MLKKISQKIFSIALVIIIAGAFPIQTFSQSKIEKMTTGDGPKDLPGSRADDYLKIHSIGLAVGQTWLYGDFEGYGDDGISWDLYYNYSASHTFDLLVDFHWNKFSNDSGGRETLLGLVPSAAIKFYQFDNFTPYAILGLGFYSSEVMSDTIDSDAKIVLGFTYGLGLDLRLNRRFKVGAIWQVHNPFGTSQPDGSEVDGSYGKLLLALFYSF
ncbi:MAG: outer membrane beta-barrel protein [Bacteriovoracales bacterium]